MNMPFGKEVYDVDVQPVKATGTEMSDHELDVALAGKVSDILWDTVGQASLTDLLQSLASTSFAIGAVERILNAEIEAENWRVGEAIAEAFLNEHRGCQFPWPSGRDLKNPSASPAGTDLVGFQCLDDNLDEFRYAFGEVKTSEEESWPPSVVYGRHGLTGQLEELRDGQSTKDSLVKYLGHHADRSTWQTTYQIATARYLSDHNDISIFGILIRDVEPNPEDLQTRAKSLADGCVTPTSIELRAIYLPNKAIRTLTKRASQARGMKYGS